MLWFITVDGNKIALYRIATLKDKQRCFTLIKEAYIYRVFNREWIADWSKADIVKVIIV